MLFRGLLLPCLAKHMSLAAAVVWTAIIFSALHCSLTQFLPLCLISTLFSSLYACTQNLAAPMVAHCLYNVLQFAMLVCNSRSGVQIMV